MVIFPAEAEQAKTAQTRFRRPVSTTLSHVLKIFALSFAALVIYESLAPAGNVQSVKHLDKIVHAGVYAVLGFILAGGWPRISLIILFIITSAFGGALEIAQGMMTLGRTASIGDAIANSLGAGLACLAWIVMIKVITRRKRVEA